MLTYSKQIAQKAFPELYHSLREKFGEPAQYRRVANAIVQQYGRKVIDGPFKGMNYVESAAGSAYAPKLIGCYEQEVHPFISKIICSAYNSIIDIGCAEGYYAIGLALCCPGTPIYAFDGDANARQLCAQMAKLNNVESQVTIGGFCETAQLNQLPLRGALLICDAEGYESELLRPDIVADLEYADILVELHEPFIPGITSTVLSRFQASHQITVVDTVGRNSSEHSLIHFLSERDQQRALAENRPGGQQYAFMMAVRKSRVIKDLSGA